MTHNELAARIERAEGPDRALDCLIHEAMGNIVDHAYAEMHSAEETPFYTASIDAAMQLVPEGCGWRIWVPSEDSFQAHRATIWAGRGRPMFSPFDVEARSPALALCAAALRARSAS